MRPSCSCCCSPRSPASVSWHSVRDGGQRGQHRPAIGRDRTAGTRNDADHPDFEDWVRTGAPDPRDAPATEAQITADTDWEAVMKRRMSWWSFQPIKKADLSRLPANGGSGHPVDRFLSARLAEAGLPRAATADRLTLIRRSSYALRGLSPSPNGIEDCLRDSPDRAYERLADSFLASTRFGERWARHWMDWIRYADSHGRLGAGCGTLAGAQAWRAHAEATGGVNEHRLRQCEYTATFGATATAGWDAQLARRLRELEVRLLNV